MSITQEEMHAIMAEVTQHSVRVDEETATDWTLACGARFSWSPIDYGDGDCTGDLGAHFHLWHGVPLRIGSVNQLRHLLAGLGVRRWEGAVNAVIGDAVKRQMTDDAASRERAIEESVASSVRAIRKRVEWLASMAAELGYAPRVMLSLDPEKGWRVRVGVEGVCASGDGPEDAMSQCEYRMSKALASAAHTAAERAEKLYRLVEEASP